MNRYLIIVEKKIRRRVHRFARRFLFRQPEFNQIFSLSTCSFNPAPVCRQAQSRYMRVVEASRQLAGWRFFHEDSVCHEVLWQDRVSAGNFKDLKAARDALGKSEEPLPWEQVKAKLDAQFGLLSPAS